MTIATAAPNPRVHTSLLPHPFRHPWGSFASRLTTALAAPAAMLIPAVFFLAAVLPGEAQAQYFGRNKVQYQSFDFRILHTPHFDVYFYPEEREAAGYAARMAERWYTRHSEILSDTLRGRQPLILYAGFPSFEETNVVQGIGYGTGGVTEPSLRRVVLPFAGPLAETDHVIGHELVHAFQYDITGKGRYGSRGAPGAERLPLWFIEGMAEYLSLGPVDPNTAMWMREATAANKIPKISDLDNTSKYFPYRYGQALLAYIGGRWGDDKMARLLRSAAASGDMNAAIDSVLAIKPDSLSKQWAAALHAQYDSLAARTKRPQDYGRVLIKGKTGRGDLNVSPAISPDGNRIAFFSSRNNFSIDLYLADANTGKILRNIYKTELDTHLEGLEFISAAGAWAPDGKHFAFSATRKARPVIEIIDVEKGKTQRELRFAKLDQILGATFSPDGKSIAFSAMQGGLSDLYVCDIASRKSRRLTEDPYADLMPAWSPDGSTLVFSTDRFTSDVDILSFGDYQLAAMDLASGEIRRLGGFQGADNINPQWSADGRSVFFISNRQGIPNIYRQEVGAERVDQVTDLYGGVSGITALSPAISVAAKTDRLVYSDFEDNKYSIWTVEPARLHEELPLLAAGVSKNPAALPPEHRESRELTQYLSEPRFGLPKDTTSFAVGPYSAKLKLLGAGQASLGGGIGPFGNYVGGGLALYFSDILGNRNLETAFSVQSGSGTSALMAGAAYFNTAHRMYWGGQADQVPYISVASAVGVDNNGNPVQEDLIYKETDRELQGAISYPFSQVLRTELSAGFLNVSFSQKLTTTSLVDGSQLASQSLPGPPSISLATGSAALVYDNSLYGATSPIQGRRSRLQASPNVGTLDWTEFLADYRQYFMPVRPFTLAGRVLHYGRYGKSAEDSLLAPIYLGYPGLVRGYDQGLLGSSTIFYTSANGVLTSPVYGTKIIVASAEFRWPLLGVLHVGHGFYGAFPVETATFYDTGVAWSSSYKPRFLGGHRRWISSWGQALRVNVFGYAVAEIDYVKPLSSVAGPLDTTASSRKWIWQLNLVEGF